MIVVEVEALEVFGRHGATEEEREAGQTFLYDLRLEVSDAALSDRLEDTVNYVRVAETVREVSEARLSDSGFALSELDFERVLELRYVGQQWPLAVPASVLDVARIRADFEARHARQYGHYQPDGEIEIVHLRLAGIGRLRRVPPPAHGLTKTQPVPYAHRSLYLDAQTGFATVPVYDGNQLRPGQNLDGPALIEERNTTILIGHRDHLEVDAGDNFLISVAARGAMP